MDFKKDDVRTLERIMTWRRDVRHFRADPIPDDLIQTLERAMDLAPSVGNARPWRVIQVNAPDLRANVMDNFVAANAAAAEIYKGDQQARYKGLKLAGLEAAPLQLAVFTDMEVGTGHGLGRQTMPQALTQSTSMAIYTLWLVARAHNLGLGMVSILEPETIKSLFDVPPHWQFSAYLCLGWPEAEDDTPLLHRVSWQENTRTRWQVK
ncbi:MAG: 5,6-dimethylbenzimidazole synthase [Pseudomonadota bacterium]